MKAAAAATVKAAAAATVAAVAAGVMAAAATAIPAWAVAASRRWRRLVGGGGDGIWGGGGVGSGSSDCGENVRVGSVGVASPMAAAAIVAATWQKSTSGSKFMDRKDSLRSFIFFESAFAVQTSESCFHL